MGLPAEQRFPRSSAVGRYWLARCEGFRARSGARDVGTIEQVRCTSWQQDAYSLVIKAHGRRVSVSVDRVVEIDPWAETVELAPRRRLRKHLGRSAEAAGRMSIVTARAARMTARGAQRYAPVLLERSRDATSAVRRRSRRAGAWSAPRARHGALIMGRMAARAAVALAAACVLVATVVADAVAWLRPRVADALAWLLPRIGRVGRSTARLVQSALSRAVSRSTSPRRPV